MVAKRCLKTLQSSDITIFTHTNSFPLRVTDTQTLTQLTLSCTRTYPHSLPRRAQSHIKSHSVSPLHTHTLTHSHFTPPCRPSQSVAHLPSHKPACTHIHTHIHTRVHISVTLAQPHSLSRIAFAQSHVTHSHTPSHKLSQTLSHSLVRTHSLVHTHSAPFPNRQG